jgi:hypothetical protein
LQIINKEIGVLKMSEKKVVRRSTAIGLGVLCIILLIGTVGAVVYYNNLVNSKDSTYNSYVSNHSHSDSDYNSYVSSHSHADSDYNSVTSQLSSANAQNTNLQTWLNGNVTALANANNQINSLQSQLASANSQIDNLNSIIGLKQSTVWVKTYTLSQGNGQTSYWTFSASYAGYVSVLVESSTVAGTHVHVIYSAYEVNFDQEIVVSAGDTAVFPILPSSNIQVGVGNGLIIGSGATETVTITYHY